MTAGIAFLPGSVVRRIKINNSLWSEFNTPLSHVGRSMASITCKNSLFSNIGHSGDFPISEILKKVNLLENYHSSSDYIFTGSGTLW